MSEDEESKVPTWQVVAIGLGAVAGVVLLALLGWCWSNGGREDLAAWIESLATLAAVAAASIAALYASRAYIIEERRDRDRAREQTALRTLAESEQARKVFLALPTGGLSSTSPPEATFTLTITNDSDDVIHDVRLEMVIADSDLLADGAPATASKTFPVVPARQAWNFPHTWTLRRDEKGQPVSVTESSVQGSAMFTDINKVVWQRDRELRLHRDPLRTDPSGTPRK